MINPRDGFSRLSVGQVSFMVVQVGCADNSVQIRSIHRIQSGHIAVVIQLIDYLLSVLLDLNIIKCVKIHIR